MTKNNYAATAYKAQAIMNAPRLKIVQMLYAGAVSNLRQSIMLLEAGEDIKYRTSLVKAQSIISELFASLDYDRGEGIADSLASIYQFCLSELMDANLNKTRSSIDSVLKIISTLEEGWQSIKDEEDPLTK